MLGCCSGELSVTTLLSQISNGDRAAFDSLMPLVYDDLHRIASGYLRRELRNRTLQPTALVHEAYLRLIQSNGASYRNRTHFLGIAARVMRQFLVDHARARQALKRGGGAVRAWDPKLEPAASQDRIVIELDAALNRLADQDRDLARLVEMRFFGGMTAEEIAATSEVPVHVVRRELRTAQAWLRREMEG